MKLIFKILRAPAFHFILIGAFLFGFHQIEQKYFSLKSSSLKEEIVIQKDQIEQFKKDIKTQTGQEANAQQVRAAIETAIDDEVLYRQALKLKLDQTNMGVRHRLVQIAKFVSDGSSLSEQDLYRKALELKLDRSDLVVRRQLITNMKLIVAKIPSKKEPSKLTSEQIQTYYDENKKQFEKPERISFSHIYLSRDKWKKKGDIEAARVLKDLQAKQAQPPLQTHFGDSFLMGNRFSGSSPSILQRYFGSAFVSQVYKLEPGKWQGPIPSSYGWHLVWVEEIKEAQVPALKEVLNQVEGNILQDREVIRLKDSLIELRSHYKIRVDSEENSHA